MAKQVVIFYERDFDSALYLSKVRFGPDGRVLTGYVINGQWDYDWRDDDMNIPRVVFDVPKDKQSGGYNAVIDWAITQYKEKLFNGT